MKKEGVTIIIPTYNNVLYIEECLDSIEKQTYFINNDEYEVLVGVDGCINTLEKILSIKYKYRNLKIFYMEENMGAYVAMNTLIPISEYNNLIFFGSDDIMKVNMINDLIDISDDFDVIQYKFDTFLGDVSNKILQQSNHMFANGCIYVKKNVFDICGGYCDNKFSSDLEFLLRVNDFVKLHKLDKSLFMYRKHNKNLTSTVPLSERALFDNKIRNTKYTFENVKIDSKKNKITNIY